MESDRQLARAVLAQGDYSVVAVHAGEVLGTAAGHGVRPLLELADRLGPRLAGAAVADQVVGRAAAWLCRAAGVATVHAGTLSDGGATVLAAGGIPVTWEQRVPAILNREQTGPCPAEAAVAGAPSAAGAVAALRSLVSGRR